MSRIVINKDRCKGCGLCTIACPYDLVQISDHFNLKGHRPAEWRDPQANCTACANCAIMCPDMAITVFRTPRHNGAGPSQQTRAQQATVRPVSGQETATSKQAQ